ncbi:MAG: PAS domain S-box protein [Acidobacteriaceae bacterium]
MPDAGQARSGSMVFFHDFSDPKLLEWKEKAEYFGLGGSAHTLFHGPSGGLGALVLCRGVGQPFPENLMVLMDGLRSDLENFLSQREASNDLVRMNQYQEAVIAAHQQFLRMQNQQEIFERLVEIVVEQTDTLGAFVVVPQDGSEWLKVTAAAAKSDTLRQALLRLTPSRDPDNFPYCQMVSSRVFREKTPVLSDRFHSDPALRVIIEAYPALAEIHSSMGWPLLEDEGKGPSAALVIEAEDPRLFTSSLRKLLQQLAESLTLALSALRLRESEKRLQQYQEAAIVVQQSLLQLQDPLDMLQHLADTIVERTDALAVHVVMPLEGTDELKAVVASAHDPALRNVLLQVRGPKGALRFSSGETLASRVYQEKCAVYADATEVPWIQSRLEQEPSLRGIRAFVCWPIMLEGDGSPYAVLVVNVEDPRHFTEGLRQLLRQLSNSFSLAIEQLRHRKLEKQQNQQLRLYKAALDSVDHGILISNQEDKTLYINPGFTKITGYAEDEMIGRNCRILQGPGTHPEAHTNIRSALDAKRPFCGEILNYRKDGTPFWNLLTISPIFDDSGQVTHFVGLQQDITERKQRDEALRASEEKFHRLFMDAPIPLVYTNKTGNILNVNHSFTKLFGYTHDDIPTLAEWGKCAYPDPDYRMQVRDRWKDAVAQSVEAGMDVPLTEYCVTCKDGTKRTVLIGGIPIQENFLSSFVDVTERYAQEQANRALNAKLQTLLATTTAGIDVVRYPERVFTEVNQAFLDILGIKDREEILGHSTNEIFADNIQGQRTAEVAQQAMDEGHSRLRDLEVVRKDGRRVFVDVDAQRLEGGDPAHPMVVWTSVDVTERKHQEDALRKLSLAVEQNPSSIVITGLDGNIEYVNGAFCQATGYTPEEVHGQNPRVLQSGKTPKETYTDMWETLLRGETWRGEFINRAKDGREYIEHALISPVRQTDGRTTHYLAIKEDITERRKQEEALRASEEKSHRLFMEAPVALALSAPDGTVLDINYRFTEILGYSKEDVPTLHAWAKQAFPWPSYRKQVEEEWVETIARAKETGKAIPPIERRVVCKDGDVRTVMVSGDFIGKEFLSSILDITERKEMEMALQSSLLHQQRLTQFNALLGEANQLIARTEEEHVLLQGFCDLAIRYANLRLAWLGRPDSEGRFQFLAASGAVGYLDGLSTSINTDLPEGNLASGTTWRTGRPFYVPTLAHSSATAIRISRAKQFGIASVASFPIVRGDAVWAVLAIYSSEENIFDEGLRALLEELARDIGFGLDRIDLAQKERTVNAFNEALLNNMTAGVSVMAYPERAILRVNQRLMEIFGASTVDDIVGHPAQELYPDMETYHTVKELSQKVMTNGSGILRDVPCLRRDGNVIYADLSGQRADTGTERTQYIIWTYVDVSERHQLEKKLMIQAFHDSLTGLPNRASLEEYLEKSLARAFRNKKKLAVCMLDMDDFKSVNDTYGHDAGDRLLKTVAERLQAFMRKSDFIARLGGDEFVLVFEEIANQDALSSVMSNVQHATEMPVALTGQATVSIQASIGVCLYGPSQFEHAETSDSLLRRADQAMYQAKEHKADRKHAWFLYEGKHTIQTRAQKLLAEGGLRVFYQPLLEGSSRRIVGVEALARLQEDDGRYLLPKEFLHRLQSKDLFELCEKIVVQALMDMEHLGQQGLSMKAVSINVAPSSMHSGCVDALRRTLAERNISPSLITLEILESDEFSAPGPETLQVMAELKGLGIHLALDDVGNAYSSLLRLQDLPVDTIKLAQESVRGLQKRPQYLHVITALQELAQGLGINLVVEGVETEEILDAMMVLGVTLMQGHAIAHPMPIAELEEWLRHAPDWKTSQNPSTLLGVYAEQISHFGALHKAIAYDPSILGELKLEKVENCPLHEHLHRLGYGEGSDLCRHHQEYHHALGRAWANFSRGPQDEKKEWKNTINKYNQAMLTAIQEELQRKRYSLVVK